MKTQFDPELLSSFYLWFENYLVKDKNKAYETGLANTFKHVNFKDLPASQVGYQGVFRSLVADADIDVPNTGFFVGGSFVTADTDANGGVLTDYQNGRLIFPVASGSSLSITANSTVKEINVYTTSQTDEEILMSSDFKEDGAGFPYLYSKDARLDEVIYALPACFISTTSSDNKEFAFGGEEDTRSSIKVMVITDGQYMLDSTLSCFRDSVRTTFSHIPYESMPYGNKFSLKNYPYSYVDTEAALTSPTKSFIEGVKVTKVTVDKIREFLNKNLFIGFIDFDISTLRFPRL
jgi:hypothetical protein|tara:strand:+ start:120 stop:995 length:876 start_codon:yes stop_codon:yes gene_type:complete